jgi:membrane protein DedA with SNARE-associated domain
VLIVGVTFIVGVYPLMLGWQSGWRWEPNQHEYEQMIVVIYATLGVFLVRASRDPLRHLSLIWFTVWSTAAHAAVMALHALAESGERGHLVGDVPAAFAIAAVLAWVTARSTAATTEDAR